MLHDIREYVRENHTATLQEIADHFDLDPEVARGMLDHWVAKGRVEVIDGSGRGCCAGSCGDCSGCFSKPSDTYRWREG